MTGTISFVNSGQEDINPELAAVLRDTSAAIARPLLIQSGYRSPSQPREAAKIKKSGLPGNTRGAQPWT